MDARRLPQPVHVRDDFAPAPGDLELVRSFLSLHDHEEGNDDSFPPSVESMRWWLGDRGFVRPTEARPDDLAWALRVRKALVQRVRENMGEPRDVAASRVLDRAADRCGLGIRFAGDGEPPIRVRARGVRGAIGSILARAFLAELDHRWERFRICGDPECGNVFYDRSSNRTGKWCSMAVCGNRNKVRAFRERQDAG